MKTDVYQAESTKYKPTVEQTIYNRTQYVKLTKTHIYLFLDKTVCKIYFSAHNFKYFKNIQR
jgi:hypothetical protein